MAREEVERQRKGAVFASPSGGALITDEDPDLDDPAASLPSGRGQQGGGGQRGNKGPKEPYNWQRWVKRREPEGAETYRRPVAFVSGQTLHDASPEQGVMVLPAPKAVQTAGGGDDGSMAAAGKGNNGQGAASEGCAGPSGSEGQGLQGIGNAPASPSSSSHAFLFSGEAVLDYVRLAYAQDPWYSNETLLGEASSAGGRTAAAASPERVEGVASALQRAAEVARGSMPSTSGAQQQVQLVFAHGLWRIGASVCVPDCSPLRQGLLTTAHQVHSRGQGGEHATAQATLAALQQLGFWWPGVEAAVQTYVRACGTCAARGADAQALDEGRRQAGDMEVVAEQQGEAGEAGEEQEDGLLREAARSRGRAWMQQLMAEEGDEAEGADEPAGALAEEEEDEGVAEREDQEGHHPGLGFASRDR